MARTSVEISLQGKSIDEIMNIIDLELRQHNYEPKVVKGENVWSKGDGVIMKRQCFGVSFTESSVILQGWLQDAITGESDLSGFVGALPKKKMKAIMETISRRI